ncbi:helix-turn-helix domain-containing protein [Aerococcus urinae]
MNNEDNLDKKEIGKRIRMIRQEKGLTTDQFSKIFDPPASKGTVSKWENGHYLPNTKRLSEIAKFGNITVNQLLHGNMSGYEFLLLSSAVFEEELKGLLTSLDSVKKLKEQGLAFQDEASQEDVINSVHEKLENIIKEYQKSLKFIIESADKYLDNTNKE